MTIDEWILANNPKIMEGLLVDIFLASGAIYSGHIDSVAYAEDKDIILLASRNPNAGGFKGKKIDKLQISSFGFSSSPRANFGVHNIKIGENELDLQFQHNEHGQQQALITGVNRNENAINSVNSRDKFNERCMDYINNLKVKFLFNEQIDLALYKNSSKQTYQLGQNELIKKVKEFLGIP